MKLQKLLALFFVAIALAVEDIVVQEVDENDQPIGKPYVPSRHPPPPPQHQPQHQPHHGSAPTTGVQTHKAQGQALPTSGIISGRHNSPRFFNNHPSFSNPWQQLASLERELDNMNRAFGEMFPAHQQLLHHQQPYMQALQDPFFGGAGQVELARAESALWRPVVDVVERPDALVFHSELPGVKKEDVEISLRGGNTLVISGKRASRRDVGAKGSRFHSIESSSGAFSRSFRLPANTDKDSIKADFSDGILDVVVPKKVAKLPDRKIEL